MKCIQYRNGRSQVFDGLIKIMFNRMESSGINNIVTFLTLNHKLKYKLDKVNVKKKNSSPYSPLINIVDLLYIVHDVMYIKCTHPH